MAKGFQKKDFQEDTFQSETTVIPTRKGSGGGFSVHKGRGHGSVTNKARMGR